MERRVLITRGEYKGREGRVVSENQDSFVLDHVAGEREDIRFHMPKEVCRRLPDRIEMHTNIDPHQYELGGVYPGEAAGPPHRNQDAPELKKDEAVRPMPSLKDAILKLDKLKIGEQMRKAIEGVPLSIEQAAAAMEKEAREMKPFAQSDFMRIREDAVDQLQYALMKQMAGKEKDEDDLMFYPNDPASNAEQLKRAKALIKAMRERSKAQGEKNARMSQSMDLKDKIIAEQKREIDALLSDMQGYKERENETNRRAGTDREKLVNAEQKIEMMERRHEKAMRERDEWMRTSQHNHDQVTKGNHTIEKMKDTVEELHDTISRQRDEMQEDKAAICNMMVEAKRKDKIIDRLIGNYEN